MQTAETLLRRQEGNSPEAALEKFRDELELLGYALSHDVLAPLRNIMGACEDLSRQKLDGEAKAAADTIAGEAALLKTLMQGMVDYIRLETYSTGLMSLDCNELVEAAKAALGNEIAKSGTVIECGPLPQVLGHRGRLTRLFAYLIDNAITFAKDKKPRVRISSRRENGNWLISIEDNGIGIDKAHHEVIFRLFQRLHASAYPGHGIGLALARKIVQTYGGTLWVESAPGSGSKFTFTLPPANE